MSESTSDNDLLNKQTVESMIDFMGEEDDQKAENNPEDGQESKDDDKDDSEKETEGEEDEEIKLSEDEEDEKKDDEKDEELVLPVKRGVILKKYPNVFKDFPILEKAYFNHQKYSEIFPTPKDAEEAVDRLETFDKFESEVVGKGDLVGILKAVKEANPDSFAKIADDYFDMLGQVDQQAQYHVAGSVVKGLIVNMAKAANRMGERGEPLLEAAKLVNQYIFGTEEFEPHKRMSKGPEESEKERALREREENFVKNQYESAREDLNRRVTNVLRSTIADNIDPKGTMSAYVKKNAINDVLDAVNQGIRTDNAFIKRLDNAWKNAHEKNFNEESKLLIRRAILGKAKTLLRGEITRVRNEAIRGLDKSRKEDTDRRGPLKPGRAASDNRSSNKSKDVNTKGMRTLDALNALMDD